MIKMKNNPMNLIVDIRFSICSSPNDLLKTSRSI